MRRRSEWPALRRVGGHLQAQARGSRRAAGRASPDARRPARPSRPRARVRCRAERNPGSSYRHRRGAALGRVGASMLDPYDQTTEQMWRRRGFRPASETPRRNSPPRLRTISGLADAQAPAATHRTDLLESRLANSLTLGIGASGLQLALGDRPQVAEIDVLSRKGLVRSGCRGHLLTYASAGPSRGRAQDRTQLLIRRPHSAAWSPESADGGPDLDFCVVHATRSGRAGKRRGGATVGLMEPGRVTRFQAVADDLVGAGAGCAYGERRSSCWGARATAGMTSLNFPVGPSSSRTATACPMVARP